MLKLLAHALAVLVTAAVGPLAATPALASDYPTKPDEMDKLCEVIGKAPNTSVPPKDRLWFTETCTCDAATGCGRAGSERLAGRRRDGAAEAATLQQKWVAIEPFRIAFWKCMTDAYSGRKKPPPYGTPYCDDERKGLSEACTKVSLSSGDCFRPPY